MSLKSFISDCFCVLYEQNTPQKQEPVPMIIDSKVWYQLALLSLFCSLDNYSLRIEVVLDSVNSYGM